MSSSENSYNPTLQRPTRVRYWVIASAALMAVLLYLDRFCFSLAEFYIKEDLDISSFQIGLLFGAFFLSYALGQVPSGWLSDRFGARVMLTIYIVVWSVFTGLMGLMYGFAMLFVLRLGFGLGQAGAYPTSANILSKWVPFAARGRASSFVAVGGRVGLVLAPLLTTILIVAFVPLRVSSLLEPDDVMDPPRLCQELIHGRDAKKESGGDKINAATARLGKKILDRLTPQQRRAVEAGAVHYRVLQKENKLPKEQQRTPNEISRKTPRPSDKLIKQITGQLNAVLPQAEIFTSADIGVLPLEKEAERLQKIPSAQRSGTQNSRLNRLILEAAYPRAVKKVYGAGWRWVMLVYGLVGLLVAGWFWICVRSRPNEHPSCNTAELELIQQGRPPSATNPNGKIGAVPLRELLTSRSMWLSCLSQWCTNIGWIFIFTWFPRYLIDVYQVPIETRGLMVLVPAMVGWFGMIFGGWLTDRLVKMVGLRWGRALPMSLSRFVAMLAYLVCLYQQSPTPWVVVGALAVVAFSTDSGTAAGWAFVQDVGGRHTASVLGWGNMWGNFGAAFAGPFFVWIVDIDNNPNWDIAFITCAIAFLCSGIAAAGINATIPIVPEDGKANTGDK